jgi:hypothetical protein
MPGPPGIGDAAVERLQAVESSTSQRQRCRRGKTGPCPSATALHDADERERRPVMLKQVLRRNREFRQSSKGRFSILELGICLGYFYLGYFEVTTAWDNPRHVGWIEGGSIYMLGAVLCAIMVWHRRKTSGSALLYILLLPQLAQVTQGGLAWASGNENAPWPTANSLLLVFVLALIAWEWRSTRKFTAEESLVEEKLFEPNDSL